MIDVGLDYLQLGQPASTLSGGEAQRLKLAGRLSVEVRRGERSSCSTSRRPACTSSDVEQLIDCFNALVERRSHTAWSIEHNVPMMMAADWLVDLGPGAADEGGRVVAQGTPETGRRL